MMFLCVFLLGVLHVHHVSSCDHNCADKPVFTPSSLVVKHGDPTSATCVLCHNSCQDITSGLEKSQGVVTENGTTLVWTVDRVTEWDSTISCYYNAGDNKQCCTDLPVTVYQPPDHVSISFVNHTGPMIEGHQYQLQCTVKNVAPARHLAVTFYRGETALDQLQSKSSERFKPVTETFTLNINASKEDDGAQFWCEAKLELGPEGPQPPPVVKSENITAAVNYTEPTSTRPPPTTTPTEPATSSTTAAPVTSATTTTAAVTTTSTATTPTTSMTTTAATTTTTKTTIGATNSNDSLSVYRFIVCFMLLFSALV